MSVTVTFNGHGFFVDADAATEVDGEIAAGVPFQTTRKRLKQLQEQGRDVTEVPKAKPPVAPAEEPKP